MIKQYTVCDICKEKEKDNRFPSLGVVHVCHACLARNEPMQALFQLYDQFNMGVGQDKPE